jgi:hypothetical protein
MIMRKLKGRESVLNDVVNRRDTTKSMLISCIMDPKSEMVFLGLNIGAFTCLFLLSLKNISNGDRREGKVNRNST